MTKLQKLRVRLNLFFLYPICEVSKGELIRKLMHNKHKCTGLPSHEIIAHNIEMGRNATDQMLYKCIHWGCNCYGEKGKTYSD